jgi:hypothetical protein
MAYQDSELHFSAKRAIFTLLNPPYMYRFLFLTVAFILFACNAYLHLQDTAHGTFEGAVILRALQLILCTYSSIVCILCFFLTRSIKETNKFALVGKAPE